MDSPITTLPLNRKQKYWLNRIQVQTFIGPVGAAIRRNLCFALLSRSFYPYPILAGGDSIMKIPIKRICNAAVLAIAAAMLTSASTAMTAAPTDTLPTQISDAEFWRFVTEYSEPNGPYPYENYVGNEVMLQRVIPAARKQIKPGGVYIGVGPEQNFTYALALEAKMAFVVDIRRQNMLELLLYKAMFEMTDNRADFVSKLFSRKRPPNLDAKTNVTAMFDAYRTVQADEKYQQENIRAIKSVLAKHGFTLSDEDLQTIERVHAVFYRAGPAIDYTFEATQLPPRPPAGFPSFERMMIATDGDCGSPCLASYSLPPAPGRNWSFLATEENFQYVRTMQRRNLLIPLVGDFAGPGTIRRIGQYLKEHSASVSAFYASNVEYYLDDRQQQDFYANVLTLPTDSSSVFLRFISGTGSVMPWWNSSIGNTSVVSRISDLRLAAPPDRRLPSYLDLLRLLKDPYGPSAGLGN
jgi:hypothetical protein